jgi:hypothetical protein
LRHDVRFDAVVLVCEQGAGPAAAGLRFVEDQQQAMLVAQCPQPAHEIRRGGDDAGLALDRFQHDGDGVGVDPLPHRFEVVQHRFRKTRYLGREQAVPARFAAGRHGGQGAAVKAVDEGDDFERAVLVQLPPFPRQLDRAFVGLGAGTAEEDVIEAAVLGEQLRQFQRRCVVEGRAGVDQGFRLIRQRPGHRRRRMAEAVHRPALHPVEVALAGVVIEIRASATDKDQVRAGRDGHQTVVGEVGLGLHEGLLGSIQAKKKPRVTPWP